MRVILSAICLSAAVAWAADRDLSLREGETRAFKLPGVAQIAIDDASVVEGVTKNDQLTVTGHRAGAARILVLLKNDQWVTFKVKVLASDVPAGPVPETLPGDGQPIHLKVGEVRAFETPGIARMPTGAQSYEAKVAGKRLELRGVAAGRALLDLWLSGGARLQLPVVVGGGAKEGRPAAARAEALKVPLSGEVLLKVADLEAVQVDDDEVAEVRIVGDGRVVVRGLQEGETVVNVRRAGRVEAHPVTVAAPSTGDF